MSVDTPLHFYKGVFTVLHLRKGFLFLLLLIYYCESFSTWMNTVKKLLLLSQASFSQKKTSECLTGIEPMTL